MMVINKAETHEGIQPYSFFLTAIRIVPYRWLHRSTSLIGKVAEWRCSFCRTQTICSRVAKNTFAPRKQYVYGA